MYCAYARSRQLVMLVCAIVVCVQVNSLPVMSEHVCSVWFTTSHCWLSSRGV